MHAKTNLFGRAKCKSHVVENARLLKSDIYSPQSNKTPATFAMLPSPVSRTVHHARIVVPTLSLSTKQSLSDSGIALLLVLHSRLQDTRVRKID